MTQPAPTAQDLEQLKENYFRHIIEGMDSDSLELLCHDLLMDAYKEDTWDDIQEEIVDLYDEDTLIDLLPVTE